MFTGLMIASIIATVASAGVGIYQTIKQNKAIEQTNELNKQMHAEDQAFNADEAQKQRDWEEEMSNTAVQRKAADLEAAGFNPALAAVGTPASTPSGSAASSNQPISMKAADYSPLSAISSGLNQMVHSAQSISYLSEFAKRNPQAMQH